METLKQKLLVMASCFAWSHETDRKVAVPIYSCSCTEGITFHRYLYIYACTALKLNEIARASGEHMISREGEKTVDIIERIRPFSSKLFFFFLVRLCQTAARRQENVAAEKTGSMPLPMNLLVEAGVQFLYLNEHLTHNWATWCYWCNYVEKCPLRVALSEQSYTIINVYIPTNFIFVYCVLRIHFKCMIFFFSLKSNSSN